ncbi:site-specific integrase [Inhella crocodyli]|uniref:Site-specific integrase n=1 Tax=Inhella crocodyli TaxID=2499851 RepID=A0A437LAN7_9BURK|nr:site-specific integrase [Inhella crocodyli]RVT82465.1 site-specific integrase [Inhella crocodyli]
MDGLQRRPSGIYVARLAVPEHLRKQVGQRELIRSTGTKELALAKIVAGQLLSSWRQQLFDLERMASSPEFDIDRALVGSPLLSAKGHLDLETAARVSGLGVQALLLAAAEGRLQLFVRAVGLSGYVLKRSNLDRDVIDDRGAYSLIVPPPHKMPSEAAFVRMSAVLSVPDGAELASALLAGRPACIVLLDDADDPSNVFAPDQPIDVGPRDLWAAATDVDHERGRIATRITPAQREHTRRVSESAQTPELFKRPLKTSIPLFLSDHARPRADDQSRRVEAACILFLELVGSDLCGRDLTRDMVRRYRDELLPQVPANENKIRLRMGTHSVTESIAAVQGTNWPRLSAAEQAKRMKWLGGWLSWLAREDWTSSDHAHGLVGGGAAGRAATASRKAAKNEDKRSPFDDEDLTKIFSADWFLAGKGQLTAKGTYREWMPYYTWLPLLGLFTGARINELAQLSLKDIKQMPGGTWVIDITEADDPEDGVADQKEPSGDGELTGPGISAREDAALKRIKNSQSRRKIPVHSQLVRLGLLEWRASLLQAGHDRLFPELRWDPVKGYGKDATKWFTRFLKSKGLARNGRKVFHSFRHTVSNRLVWSLGETRAVNQIMGHSRGKTMSSKQYTADEARFEPGSPIVEAIETLQFSPISRVAVFDCDAGLNAVKDALRRKHRRD